MFTYDRSWEEIEQMLERAITLQKKWREAFELGKDYRDKDAMKEAARNHKALDGVIKTLKWTLGEEDIKHPLS